MKRTIMIAVIGSVGFGLLLSSSSLIAQETNLRVKTNPRVKTTVPAEKKIDQTGINWVMPFSAAMEKAKSENKLIAIKMIAFGTNKSGCW